MTSITLEAIAEAYQKGQYKACERACVARLKQAGNDLTTLFMYAGLLVLRNAHKPALKQYQKIKRLNPHFDHIHRYIGLCHKELKHYPLAKTHFKKNLVLFQDDLETLKALLDLYTKLEKWKLMSPISRSLLPQFPDDVDLNFAQGLSLFHQEHYQEALPCLIRVIQFDTTHLQGHKVLANCLIELKHVPQAISVMEEILPTDPHDEELLLTLAIQHCVQGHTSAAIAYLEKNCLANPSHKNKVLRDLFIPSFYEKQGDILDWRNKFTTHLNQLLELDYRLKNPAKELGYNNFYLIYQGFNDKDLQVKTAHLLQPSVLTPKIRPKKRLKDSRIRIGFFSSFFYRHAVSFFYSNLIRKLPKDFHVSLFYCPGKKIDMITRQLKRRADTFLTPPADLKTCRKLISQAQLDLLIYPSIGMQALPYYLGMTRLAPVQATLIGHPTTTGLPHIDYYFSGDIFETPEADDHYSETLLRIKGMPLDYDAPIIKPGLFENEGVKLPENKNLYTCPMSLFKVQPDFDQLVIDILDQDPHGVILFFKHYGIENALRSRLEKKFPLHMDRIVFLEKLPFVKFLYVLKKSTVLLDTFPFSGGNTALVAFAMGTPIVTLPNDFLCGRFCAGYYQYMGMTDCIAKTKKDYVHIATKLGMNPDYRTHIADEIKQKRGVLFNNTEGSEQHYELFRSLAAKR